MGFSNAASRCSADIQFRLIGDAIAHRPVPPLAFCPHALQCRVAGVDEIDDAHVGLGGMLPVQAAGISPQRFPRPHRHRQHQGVERRMIGGLPRPVLPWLPTHAGHRAVAHRADRSRRHAAFGHWPCSRKGGLEPCPSVLHGWRPSGQRRSSATRSAPLGDGLTDRVDDGVGAGDFGHW